MYTQDAICLLVSQHLHQTVSVIVGLCTAVGCQGELANFVGNALEKKVNNYHNTFLKSIQYSETDIHVTNSKMKPTMNFRHTGSPSSSWTYFLENLNIFAFSVVGQYWEGINCLNPSLWETGIHLLAGSIHVVMTRQCKELRHQQPWYWLSYPKIFQFRNQKC